MMLFRAPRIPAVISGPIGRLFLQRGPTAILRHIVAVSINAVKRHSFRPFTHISQEVDEAAALAGVPAITDGNTATAVAGIRGIAGVAASPEHGGPAFIGWSLGHAMGGDPADVLLSSTLGSNLGARFFGVTIPRRTGSADVVAADEASRVTSSRSLGSRSHLSNWGGQTAAAFAELCTRMRRALHNSLPLVGTLPRETYVPRQHDRAVRPLVVGPLNSASATAGALNLFDMAYQVIRRAITKSIWNRLFAAAFTVHPISISG